MVKNITLNFFTIDTVSWKLVAKLQKFSYAHSGFFFGKLDNVEKLLDFGAMPGGIGFRSYELDRVLKWKLVKLKFYLSKELLNYILSFEKDGYNYLGAIFSLLNIDFRMKNRFFCSQFVAFILNKFFDLDIPLNMDVKNLYFYIKKLGLVEKEFNIR